MQSKLSDHFNMLKYGAYVGVKVSKESYKTINEIITLLNVKAPFDVEEATVPLIVSFNFNKLYSNIIKTDFVPYANKVYNCVASKLVVDDNNRLLLEIICPELHERHNELKYIGFEDHGVGEGFYVPYIVLSNDYKSEKLKQDVLKGKKIQLQGEVFHALSPETTINGLTIV